MFGNTLIFSLGTLKANSQGSVTVRVKLSNNAIGGTILNFPAVLSYINPAGAPQSVSANVSAQVWSEPIVPTTTVDKNNNGELGANVFGAGFLPTNLFGWMLLIILILLLILIAKYLFMPGYGFTFQRKNPDTTPTTH